MIVALGDPFGLRLFPKSHLPQCRGMQQGEEGAGAALDFFAGGEETTSPDGTGGGAFFTGGGTAISPGRPGGGAFFAFAAGGEVAAVPVRPGGGPFGFPATVEIAFTGMSGIPGEELRSLSRNSGRGGAGGRTNFGTTAGTGGTAGRVQLVSGEETDSGRENRV